MALTKMITKKQTCELLGISLATLDGWIKSGQVQAFRVGPRLVRLRESDVRALIRPLVKITPW